MLIVLLFSPGCNSVFNQPVQSKQRFSLASLNGNYTYNLSGMIFGLPKGFNLYHEIGAFLADGNGSLVGVDDFSSGSTPSSSSFTGSYTLGNDGTGTMTLNLPGRQIQLAITMQSNSLVYLLEYDAFATGTGGAIAQSTSAFSTPLAGAFVFRFYTHVVGAGSTVTVGQMTINGGSVTGKEDAAQIGATKAHTLTGSITSPDQNGRGTLVLTDDTGSTSNYIYYLIDSHTLNLIRAESGLVGEGRSVAQTLTAFNNASLTSSFTFHLGGDTVGSVGGINTVGAYTSDGNGSITGGSLDSAADGTTSSQSFTGTYTVDSRGRVNLVLALPSGGSVSQVGWMADSTQGFFIQQDQNSVLGGSVAVQQAGPFSASSLSGEFAFRMIGFDATNPPTVGRIGVMTFDGSGTVSFADLFVNRGGVQSQFTKLSGPYTVGAHGRVSTGAIPGVTNNMVFYLTSSTSAYFLLADFGAEIGGQSTSQVPQ